MTMLGVLVVDQALDSDVSPLGSSLERQTLAHSDLGACSGHKVADVFFTPVLPLPVLWWVELRQWWKWQEHSLR